MVVNDPENARNLFVLLAAHEPFEYHLPYSIFHPFFKPNNYSKSLQFSVKRLRVSIELDD